MTLRRIGAAGLVLALFGCSDDASRKTLIEDSGPGGSGVLLARADDAKPEKDPTKAAATFKKGMEAANAGKFDEGIKLFEEAIKLDPDNRDYIFKFGLLTQLRANQIPDAKAKYALFRRSAEVARKLKDGGKALNPNEKQLLAQAIYNEACAYALDKQPEKAIASLNESIDNGFEDVENLKTDNDLDSLRKMPEFASVLTKIEERSKSKVQRELKEFHSYPFTFELPDLEGKQVKLADFKGKVTIVDIWGTWCRPCRMEIPHFVTLQDKYKDKGLAIIGVNYEHVPKDQMKSTIEAFAKELKMNYPCVLGDDKTQEQVPDFQGYPTTLFLDRQGKVRYQHVGYAPLGDLEAIVKMLLDEKS